MMKSRKPIYVLGTGLSHDGSACLLKDGRICVAIEKERLTRLKHDGDNDTEAIRYCLDVAGITFNDLSLVVQNANFGMLKHSNNWWRGTRLLNETVPVVTISHHLAHAYSAIGTSPFKEAAIMIMDGCGSSLDDCIDLEGCIIPEAPPIDLRHLYFEKDSYYIFKDNKLIPVYKDFSPWGMGIKSYHMTPSTTMHSIGGLYAAASMYIFRGFEDSGKLMGLAPYGRPGIYDFVIFELNDGRAFVRYDWMTAFDKPCRNYEQFKKDFQYYADIAYWIQKEVERAILYTIDARYETAPSGNLAYAGGVALNAVANRRIKTESKFKELYIQPAAGDNGLAVGCAYYGWLEVLKQERVYHNGSMSLGKVYDRKKIGDALTTRNGSITYSTSDNYIKKTAEHLAEGKIVGWFQDGAEFGPRALGHRSILADPRRPEMRNFINSNIKFREDFRPFAPAVLAGDVSRYFDCDYESPYMILIAPVRPEWRQVIPSVTHQDQSARIQTVTKSISPKFFELLCAFKDLTGISILLNTSFNRRGMPIVETPEQALDFFLNCDLDVLVLENHIISKTSSITPERKSITESLVEDIQRTIEHRYNEAYEIGGIYQINIAETRTLLIDLSKERPVMAERKVGKDPNMIISIAEWDLKLLRVDPEKEGFKLLEDGKIKVEGNMSYATNFVKFLRLLNFTS
jgi:carbamoyltransferase